MKLSSTDMPKLQSPFVRKVINGDFIVTPEIDREYRWVFKESIATDKIDGTNVSIIIKDGEIKSVYNRLNKIDFWSGNRYIINGVRGSVIKGYFRPESLDDGQYYGECIGDKIQGNPYQLLEENIWIPFSRIKEKYQLKYWQEMLNQFDGKSDKEIYSIVSKFFMDLYSLFAAGRGLKGRITKNTIFPNSGVAEGLVFYSTDGRMAKLRRDMFDWYKGKRH